MNAIFQSVGSFLLFGVALKRTVTGNAMMSANSKSKHGWRLSGPQDLFTLIFLSASRTTFTVMMMTGILAHVLGAIHGMSPFSSFVKTLENSCCRRLALSGSSNFIESILGWRVVVLHRLSSLVFFWCGPKKLLVQSFHSWRYLFRSAS